ncbi:hypothetical protein X801_06946, partial [Opisthorchis viverrini]
MAVSFVPFVVLAQVKTWFQNRRMKHKKMKRGYVSSGQDTQQSLPLSGKRDGNPNYPATCGTNSSCSGTEDLEYERSRKVENFLCLPPSPTSSASASETYVNLEAVQSETWRAKRQIVLDTLRNPPSKKESKSLVVSSEADVSIPVKCRISEYESAQSGKDLMTSCGVTRDASEFDDIKSSVFNPKFLMQHYFLNCPISWGGVTKLSSYTALSAWVPKKSAFESTLFEIFDNVIPFANHLKTVLDQLVTDYVSEDSRDSKSRALNHFMVE